MSVRDVSSRPFSSCAGLRPRLAFGQREHATEVARLGPGALPDFAYAVDDLAKLSDAALQSREVSDPVKVALWLLRDARDGDLFVRRALPWVRLLEDISANPATRSIAIALLTYVVRVLDEVNLGRFRVILRLRAPATEALTMTAAEALHLRGKAEGEAEGQAKGKADAIFLVLQARGLPVPDDVRRRVLSCSDLDTLSAWLERAATVASTDAVFSDA